MKRILVTGARGFLGQRCYQRFKSAGFQVLATDRLDGVDIVGDLRCENFVSSLPEVDVVINCAAVQYVTKQKPLMRERFFYENNVFSAKHLSEKYKDIQQFVHIGTSMMYKMTESDLTERDQFHGNGIYSVSKLRAQVYVQGIRNSVTVIPCIIGGKGREGLFRPFVEMIKRLPLVIVPGEGNNPLQLVHVDDVVSLIFLIVQKEARGFFNAASPQPLSINEWIDLISLRLYNARQRRVHIPITFFTSISALTGYRLFAKEQLLMLQKRHVLSVDKSIKLGWRPDYSNHQIIEQISEHFGVL